MSARPSALTEQLAFGHLSCDSREHVQDRQGAFSEAGLECRHVKPVAHQHCSLIPIKRVDGGTISARFSVVDYVVVNERRGMKKLHDRGHANRVITRAVSTDRVVGENGQRRADTLASRLTQVFREIGDDLNV